jgi:hypothetical protein
MEKRILLVGNNDGLPGVKIDLRNFKRFFTSIYGGNWYPGEIIERLNPTRASLLNTIQDLKNQNLDYCIVVFSGHGAQYREIVVEINGNGEMMLENEFKNISKKQLTIFDCCRGVLENLNENRGLNAPINKSFSASDKYIREKYEWRIASALNQQVTLYSCSMGEFSTDTNEGGLYTKNFLKRALYIPNEYKLVGENHQEAAYLTQLENNQQNPDAELPRCISSQQLIISINPNY